MDRERAKIELMQIYGSLSSNKQMAIDTLLEQESCETTTNNDEPIYINYPIITCDDTISREAVIDILQYAWESRMYIPECIREVKDLPPVEPSRRKGHWIYRREDKYSCSKCGTTTSVDEGGIEEKPNQKGGKE